MPDQFPCGFRISMFPWKRTSGPTFTPLAYLSKYILQGASVFFCPGLMNPLRGPDRLVQDLFMSKWSQKLEILP